MFDGNDSTGRARILLRKSIKGLGLEYVERARIGMKGDKRRGSALFAEHSNNGACRKPIRERPRKRRRRHRGASQVVSRTRQQTDQAVRVSRCRGDVHVASFW